MGKEGGKGTRSCGGESRAQHMWTWIRMLSIMGSGCLYVCKLSFLVNLLWGLKVKLRNNYYVPSSYTNYSFTGMLKILSGIQTTRNSMTPNLSPFLNCLWVLPLTQRVPDCTTNIAMGIPQVREYWGRNTVWSVPWFSSSLSR